MPNMPGMPNMAHSPSTTSSSQMAMTENQMQMKNSTLVKQAKIMNVNTKIEINPFYSGFNTFKISFTDPNGKPYTKITGAEMIFKNEKADIGPIVVTMNKITAKYICRWNIYRPSWGMEYSYGRSATSRL